MRKKLLTIVLVMIFVMSLMLVGCDNKEKIHIVYVGDSITEGLAGMRPVSERERDAFYGVVGIRNGYDFKNRGISGFRSGNLLEYIQKEDDGVRMTQSLLRTADIIHVSSLGNDLLLADIGKLITSVAQDDYTEVDKIRDNAEKNIADIFEVLKGYNSEATILFQTVYNPVFESSTLISASSRATLTELGYNESQYRALAAAIIENVNSVVHEYLEAHPGTFHIIDGYAEYDRIYKENPERGKDLIFVDDAHPSSEGHGILADINQAKLEELGLADAKKAVKKYKEMRIEQLERLYSETVDVKAYKKKINRAKSCSEITEIYYDAIAGKLPDYIK